MFKKLTTIAAELSETNKEYVSMVASIFRIDVFIIIVKLFYRGWSSYVYFSAPRGYWKRFGANRGI